MSRITRLGALLVAALLGGLAVGCTSTSAGEPRPEDSVTDPNDEPNQTSTSEEPPKRPREVKLDGVDACALIPQADYPDFYMDKPGEPKQDDDGSPQCLWTGTDVGYFGITLETSEGIDVWVDGSRSGKAKEAEPISGFPALTIENPNDDDVCFAAVDVAEGQSLVVQVGLRSSRPTDLPPLCEYTHQFAASAMSTLVES